MCCCTCSAHRKRSVSVICYNHCGYCCHSFFSQEVQLQKTLLGKTFLLAHLCSQLALPFPVFLAYCIPILGFITRWNNLLPTSASPLTQSTVWPQEEPIRAWRMKKWMREWKCQLTFLLPSH